MKRPKNDARASPEAAALVLSLAAVDAARWQLDKLAAMTDTPPPGTVEAADDLDAARVHLAQAVTP